MERNLLNLDLKFVYLKDHPEFQSVIADWYFSEWGIPQAQTNLSLAEKMRTELPFHALGVAEGRPIVTAGLYNSVGLTRKEERYQAFGPWLALVYTIPEFRGRGAGFWICDKIDQECRRLGINRYYLFTFTAEKLYSRLGWIPVERLKYNGHDTVVMFKDLK
ncbi:MAG: GNAT family N-acetyltransferase [Leptospira sp.]|nr:GNAT family N-acetyltransferase [Leptospira sp.]